MKPKVPITAGQRFGRWTVIDPTVRQAVLCECDCGTRRRVAGKSLFRGLSQSCGCLQRELTAERRRKAGYPIVRGGRFGRWTVIEASDRQSVLCRCDCGTERRIIGTNLVQGFSKSCGCLRRDDSHNLSRHPLYRTWYGIVLRCTHPGSKDWKNYGGRGIRICEQWLDVSTFIHDIEATLGSRPDGRQIDRIDNDGNYEPGNVRWATVKEQANNRRSRWQIRRSRAQQ